MALDAVKRWAEKIRNPAAYEKAALQQLEAEGEFAKHYRAEFPPSRQTGQKIRAPYLAPEDYCKRFGFSDRTVQRWGERIDDPAKLEAKKNEIAGRAMKTLPERGTGSANHLHNYARAILSS